MFDFFYQNETFEILSDLSLIGFYIKDSVKKLAIFTPLNCAIVCGLVWVIKTFGEMFYIYAFIFVSIIVFIMMTVYPEFIAPLFDTYSPLEDGELKEKVIFLLCWKTATKVKTLFGVSSRH